MARAILTIGEPGTGKSRAIKNLDPNTTVIVKPNAKELPFRGAAKNYIAGKNMFVVRTLKGVGDMLDQINKAKAIKTVIIEDLTHYFSKRIVDERAIKGYDKWTELAAHTKLYIIDKEAELRPDLTIIVIAHVSSVQDATGTSYIGIQTPGKLMDNTIKIPSFFTYILHTFVDQDEDGNTRYRFLTNKDGIREAKTPEEMFPKYIENDYLQVIEGITKYQQEEGIIPLGLSLEEKAKKDAAEAKKAAAKSTEAQTPTPEPVKAAEPVNTVQAAPPAAAPASPNGQTIK